MKLSKAHVVIIGGSSGMGLATAKLAKELGASITIVSRSADKLHYAKELLGDTQTEVADISREADMDGLFSKMERIDHVFVSAGRYIGGNIVDTDLQELKADMEQHFWGAIYVVRNAIPRMKQGSFTFLSGIYGSRPVAGAVGAAATLAAVETLVKGLALELAPIRFNALAPGVVDTPILGEYRDEVVKWAEATLPVKRLGMAEEVAEAAILLMQNEYITGEVLHIDGGGRYV